jgi:hypothetical protein
VASLLSKIQKILFTSALLALVLVLFSGCDHFNADFGGFVDEQLKHFRETDGTFIREGFYLTGGAFDTDTVYGSIAGAEISVTVFSEDRSGQFTAVFETGTGKKLEIPLYFDDSGQAKFTISTGSKSKEYTVTLVLSPYRARLDGRFYEKLSEALVWAPAGTGSNIIILQNITIDADEAGSIAALSAGKNITLAPDAGVTKILKRGADYTDSLFTVQSGASLKLEGSGTGRLVIDGGGITASAALVTVNGGTLTMNEGAELRNNINTGIGDSGGGVYVGGGTFNMEGGLITGNKAGNGGGVNVGGGTFSMKGGVISGNEFSYGGYGGGVYVYGTFEMSGSAVIAVDQTKNDVYLTPNHTININGSLNLPGGVSYAARITPSAYPSAETPDVTVLSTGPVHGNNVKFSVSPEGATQWFIKSDGTLISNVAASRLEGVELYGTLSEAVDAAALGTLGTLATNPDVITILQNITTSATMGNSNSGITIDGKHIKLIPASGSNITIKRWSGNTGSLFTVNSGSSLTLERNGTSGELIVDGGAVWTGGDAAWTASHDPDPAHGATNDTANGGLVASAALVSVSAGGTLTMEAGAVLQNNDVAPGNSWPEYLKGGGVQVKGNGAFFVMNGGTIKNNSISDTYASEGGGVGVWRGAKFTMNGGAISGNYAAWAGGGVIMNGGSDPCVGAWFEFNGGAISGNKANPDGGGVAVRFGSTFIMSGGTISNNEATGTGGGGFIVNENSTATMTGGTISNNEATGVGGGGLIVNENSTATMTGGTISGNTATGADGKGGGVLVWSGIFKMESGAVVDQNNDIYLPTGKAITISGALTGTGPVGRISPEEYPTAATLVHALVADGVSDAELAAAAARFTVTDSTSPVKSWFVDSFGYIQANGTIIIEDMSFELAFTSSSQLTGSDPYTLSKGAQSSSYPVNATLGVSGIPAGVTYAWRIDGAVVTDATGSTLTLGAANYPIGTHTVTLIVLKNSVPYSGSVQFKVVP